MNERIKQLYTQAYESVVNCNPSFLVTSEMINQKFAELIVQECVGVARRVGNKTKPADFALDRCYEIEEKIKQYFGVEL
jgi:hypothetical protein